MIDSYLLYSLYFFLICLIPNLFLNCRKTNFVFCLVLFFFCFVLNSPHRQICKRVRGELELSTLAWNGDHDDNEMTTGTTAVCESNFGRCLNLCCNRWLATSGSYFIWSYRTTFMQHLQPNRSRGNRSDRSGGIDRFMLCLINRNQ